MDTLNDNIEKNKILTSFSNTINAYIAILEKRRIEDDWLVADDVRREFYKLGISIPREKKHGENEFHTKYHVPYYKI